MLRTRLKKEEGGKYYVSVRCKLFTPRLVRVGGLKARLAYTHYTLHVHIGLLVIRTYIHVQYIGSGFDLHTYGFVYMYIHECIE